nr:Sua5/YciO/YrdC/YwlC family protein [Streptomyces noursei]
MLPYTPLHHLLFGLPGDPPGPRLLVMTSGNVAGDPLVIDDADAVVRLANLADAWLGHDRAIQVPCDDSVVRISDGEPLYVRRSRGCAPYPVPLPVPVRPALATGGDLKTVLCLGEGRRAWLSAHIGDMDDLATQLAFERAGAHLETLTGVRPRLFATDLHPAYRTGQWARRHTAGRPLVRVQHHHAHIAAAMAEHGLDGRQPVIGVAFDGTGYGDDGAIWGGEILLADYAGYRRFAHLDYVPQPGGDTAVRRPYRMALAHLHAAGLPWTAELPPVIACPSDELRLLERQLAREINCAPTSSMGRLFDAVSSLAGICHHAGYEAQAAVALEAAARTASDDRGPATPSRCAPAPRPAGRRAGRRPRPGPRRGRRGRVRRRRPGFGRGPLPHRGRRTGPALLRAGPGAHRPGDRGTDRRGLRQRAAGRDRGPDAAAGRLHRAAAPAGPAQRRRTGARPTAGRGPPARRLTPTNPHPHPHDEEEPCAWRCPAR